MLVDEFALRNLFVLATAEGHFDLVRLLELQTVDDNLGFAKHGANVWNNLGASIGRTDDGRNVQSPDVAQPAVAPTSKQNHLACLRIVSHRGVLAHHRWATNRLWCVPNQGAAVHHVNVVHVLVLAFLSSEAEHLVLWHRLNGAQLMVRNLHCVRRRSRRAFLHPRHRVEVEEVGVVEHGHVIAATEDHKLVWEPGSAVIETRARAVAVQHRFGPSRGLGGIYVIGGFHLLEKRAKV
mmetsp:Transcript_6921/g.28678  ORF Transcript_6921/g.28678 Transcript_6921/m.28678 type:complete len:237 (-) Transcript_6921:159-869(-)